MNIETFALERYFARHEFSAEYLLSNSDCEAFLMSDLLNMAGQNIEKIWKNLKLGYTESQGHPLLRKNIAQIYKNINEDNIIISAPEEGIFLLMHSLLKSGDHIISTFPGYQSLYEVARSIGCGISKWQPQEKTGWKFSIDQLEKLIVPSTKLVVVNFPHNPTGYTPPVEDFKALIDLVRRKGLNLLSDEMYRFLEIEEGSTLPAACDLYERSFSLFGLSKSFGLPGLRIGWIASHEKKIIRRMLEIKDYTTICNSAPSEILAIIAVQNRKKIISQQISLILKNMKVLDSFFQNNGDLFTWNRPSGSSVCFPRMLKVKSTLDFCDKLVAEAGIMLLPSKMFDYDDHHVRIGFGRENLSEVITVFNDYLNHNYR